MNTLGKKELEKSISLANKNFDLYSNFTVQELNQISDHVTNCSFVDREFLKSEVPQLTDEQLDALDSNKLAIEMEFEPNSTLVYEVLGGQEGTGIDKTSYVVAVWGTKYYNEVFS